MDFNTLDGPDSPHRKAAFPYALQIFTAIFGAIYGIDALLVLLAKLFEEDVLVFFKYEDQLEGIQTWLYVSATVVALTEWNASDGQKDHRLTAYRCVLCLGAILWVASEVGAKYEIVFSRQMWYDTCAWLAFPLLFYGGNMALVRYWALRPYAGPWWTVYERWWWSATTVAFIGYAYNYGLGRIGAIYIYDTSFSPLVWYGWMSGLALVIAIVSTYSEHKKTKRIVLESWVLYSMIFPLHYCDIMESPYPLSFYGVLLVGILAWRVIRQARNPWWD